MSLTLELSPSLEQQLQDSAARDGVPVSIQVQSLIEFALRLKTVEQRRREMEEEAGRAYAALGETEEEFEAYVNAAVKQVRAEMRAQEARP